jgi:hypothetical protein
LARGSASGYRFAVRARTVLLGICASLVLASPAGAAFTAPELFVRLQRADISHEPASDWMALAAVPGLDYIGGFQIGYRLQPTGVNGNFQAAALAITGVPDGQPTQPSNTPPYCVGKNGTAGTITPVGAEIQFEGDGTYSFSVSLGDTTGTGCVGGPATTAASFTVDVHVAPQLVGEPFAFRAKPLPGNPFEGIRTADPPGGFGDNSCALDATVAPDGSVTGRRVVPDDPDPPRQTVKTFPEPGDWACVSRGVVEGVNDSFERTFFATPWSAPLHFDVHSDFRRVQTTVIGPRKTRPTFDVKAEFPAASAGGKATLKLVRFVRCRRSGPLFKKVANSTGAFDAKGHGKFRVRRPRKAPPGYYAATLSFGGTRFVRAGTDPNLMLLAATKRAIRFVNPRDYPC